MKVVVGASTFAEAGTDALDLLEKHGIEVIKNPYRRRMSEEEIIEQLVDADGLLAGLEPLNENVLSKSPKLKAIARIGIGMDNVDVEACNRRGVKVSNTPDAPTAAVAEMTIAAIFSILRRIVPANDDMHNKTWKKQMGESIVGKRILLIGYGRIGRKVEEHLKYFGAVVKKYDPMYQDVSEKNLEEAVNDADIISVHSSGKETVITSDLINRMPDGVIILNSSRGILADENAVYDGLISGRIGFYWGDVFSDEPYSGKLTECKNAILTPHISSNTRQCRLAMEVEATNNLIRDLGV